MIGLGLIAGVESNVGVSAFGNDRNAVLLGVRYDGLIECFCFH